MVNEQYVSYLRLIHFLEQKYFSEIMNLGETRKIIIHIILVYLRKKIAVALIFLSTYDETLAGVTIQVIKRAIKYDSSFSYNYTGIVPLAWSRARPLARRQTPALVKEKV